MQGLMIKEFLYLRRQRKGILLLLIIFFAAVFFPMAAGTGRQGDGLWADAVGIAAILPVMMAVITVVNSIGYDEQAKWDKYVLSLPVSRGRIVAAKYLSAALISLAGAALAWLIGYLALSGDSRDLFPLAAASFAAPLLICAVLFPLCFRFGIQKARFIIVFLCLLPAAAVTVAKQFGFALGAVQQALVWELAPGFALAAAALLFLISCAVYRHKQV